MHALARLGWHKLLAWGLCLMLLAPALASAQDLDGVGAAAESDAGNSCDTPAKKTRKKKRKKRKKKRKKAKKTRKKTSKRKASRSAAKKKRKKAKKTRKKAKKSRKRSKQARKSAKRTRTKAKKTRKKAKRRRGRKRATKKTTRTLKRGPAPAQAASTKPTPAKADPTPQSDAIKPRARKRSQKHVDSLDPVFRPKVERVLERLRRKGWRPVVISGRRDAKQQARIVRAGRSGTMKSYHLCGRAADIADARYGWRGEAKSPKFKFWIDLGEAAHAEGLTWGGEWKRKDVPHIQSKRRCGR